MKRFTKASIALVFCGVMTALGQSPTPPLLIVQAANATATPAPRVATSAPDANPIGSAVKTLQQMKAANDETLKKQEAALQQLDEMQKAAEQLRIFSHRTGG